MSVPNVGMTGPYNVPTYDPTNVGNRPDDGPFRAGGRAPTLGELAGGPRAENNLPSTESIAVTRQKAALMIMRDVQGGTAKMKERGTAYLPQAPGEEPVDYNIRLARSVFFNVTAHTIEGLVGQVFRRNPALQDDVPVVIRGDVEQGVTGHWENIDNAGTHGDVFIRNVLNDGLWAGHNGILVEFPNLGPDAASATRRDEQDAGVRPYWIPIKKDDIVSFRLTIENGRTLLRQLVLREVIIADNGAFGEQAITQYRVLYRYPTGTRVIDRATNAIGAMGVPIVGWRVLRVTKDKRVVVMAEGLYTTQDEIPFVEIPTSGRKAMLESDPPLLDLANVNIAHYQQWSDYATSLHKTCVPILAVIGADQTDEGSNPDILVGPNAGLNLPEGGDAKYVSHNGSALGATKAALDDLKSDMGTLGLSMLSPQKRTAETAQAKQLDKATEDSALAVTARGLEDGIEKALYFHCRYLKLVTRAEEAGSIRINKIFDAQQMAAAMLTAWTQAVAQAGVPARLMLAQMQTGELIDEDEDIEAIALEMEAHQQAQADAETQRQQDLLAFKSGTDGGKGNAKGTTGTTNAGGAGGSGTAAGDTAGGGAGSGTASGAGTSAT